MKEKRMYVVLVSAVVIMISIVYNGTYSYFVSRVEGTGNQENNQSSAITEDLQNIIIKEDTNITDGSLIPGKSSTYSFTVENPKDMKICYDLIWSEVTNTFVNKKDLKIKLEKEDGTVVIENKEFPSTNNEVLVEGLKINGNTINKYILTVTYENTNEDQSADMGKSYGGTIVGRIGQCPTIATEYILAKGETDELKYDNTVDNNLRYVGSDPNNYVIFNNELWRIIGVMNNIDDGTGTKETRLKLIRNESIGQYSLDNKNVYGDNDWSTSAMQLILNEGAYWNRTTGECPYGQNGARIPCDFSGNGLIEEAKEMIGNALWNLGGSNTFDNVTTSIFYNRERGIEVYEGRPTNWIGKIGLMYPSDYGFATNGGETANREVCLNKVLYYWDVSTVNDCKNNDWLYESTINQWTLTLYSTNSSSVFSVFNYGGMSYSSTYNIYDLFPVAYLASNVKIISGDGSNTNPYQLSL